MVEFIKENSRGVSEELLVSIIDPTKIHSDHSKISRGVGMVLCSAATNRLRNGESKNLESIEILLEPTIFGTAMSGKIPENLRSKTEQACSFVTIPRTVQTLKEWPSVDGSDIEIEDRLEHARTKAPKAYDKFMQKNDQSDWDTITAEIHVEETKEKECDWAKEVDEHIW